MSCESNQLDVCFVVSGYFILWLQFHEGNCNLKSQTMIHPEHYLVDEDLATRRIELLENAFK